MTLESSGSYISVCGGVILRFSKGIKSFDEKQKTKFTLNHTFMPKML
jgi:hypothetical protein